MQIFANFNKIIKIKKSSDFLRNPRFDQISCEILAMFSF